MGSSCWKKDAGRVIMAEWAQKARKWKWTSTPQTVLYWSKPGESGPIVFRLFMRRPQWPGEH
jgi:hypothetical protein